VSAACGWRGSEGLPTAIEFRPVPTRFVAGKILLFISNPTLKKHNLQKNFSDFSKNIFGAV
jgi:hypothetical protein